MDQREWLAQQFEEKRAHLSSVAYRMLGSQSSADDAVQEAWLRLNRADVSGVDNLGGWLTTVVARVSLDMLRSRKSRREEPLDAPGSEPIANREQGSDPERETVLADSVGLALLVVLETLAPAERVAFVLHDMFDLPFEEIAPIVGRSPAAARQLASRARRRVQGGPKVSDADRARQREIVGAFLAASRAGDFEALLAVLDPDVVLHTDAFALAAAAARPNPGAPKLAPEVHGSKDVADAFSGRARAAQLALLDGNVGAVWAPGGKVRVAFDFTIAGGKIVEIGILADPDRLAELDPAILD